MKLYVSFGQKYNLRNSLMEFEGMSEEEVREYMIRVYKNKYAFIYEEQDAMEQVIRYNLNIVPQGTELMESIWG